MRNKMTLEDDLMEDIRNRRDIDIERALLIASGCKTEDKIAEYKAKIDELDRKCGYGFLKFLTKQGSFSMGERIAKVLWNDAIKNYEREQFSLADLLDNGAGNCVAIHSLFSALYLKRRKGLVIYLQDSHVMPGIQLPYGTWIPVDITAKGRFESRFIIPAKEYSAYNGLLGTTFNSRAVREYVKSDLLKAEKYALAAISLVPGFANPYFILGAIKHKQGEDYEALLLLRDAYEYSHPGSELQAIIYNIRKEIRTRWFNSYSKEILDAMTGESQ